jgi:LEA14-like dessication related protein
MKTMTSRARRAPRTALAAVLLASSLSGCAVFFKSPRVTIADVRVASVGITGGTAEIALDVVNPNGKDLKAKDVHYRFSFADPAAEGGWRLLSEGTHEAEIVVRGNDSTRVLLPVAFNYGDLGRALGGLLSTGTLQYRLDGDVKFDAPLHDPRVRFDRRGSIRP